MWKPSRKQLSSCFNNQIILSFLPIFNEKSNLFVRNIGQYIGKGHFDIMRHTSNCALDIVCGKMKIVFLKLLLHLLFRNMYENEKNDLNFNSNSILPETVLGSQMKIQEGENADYAEALRE